MPRERRQPGRWRPQAGRPDNRQHDLRPVPGAAPCGVPGRHLVRLPAPAAVPAGWAGTRLAPPGL